MQGYFTTKGFALTAKLLTGAALTITRVVAGSGNTANPAVATSLPQAKQVLAANSPTRSGNTATIPVTLTAAMAKEAYTLTELGVYARDPEEGEILYKLYRLDEPVDISPNSRLVLRFYLEETVSEDLGVTVLCSPAGLITEEDFLPVQTKTLTSSLPTRTVTVAAADLQTYLNALPRMLSEHLRIDVSAGTVTEELKIRDFHGGSIRISAAAENSCVIQSQMVIENCSAFISLGLLDFEGSTTAESDGSKLYIKNANVQVSGCTFCGDDVCVGIHVVQGSRVYVEECKIAHFEAALLVSSSSTVTVSNYTDTDFANNTYGAHIWHGGIVILAEKTPDTLGGAANIKSGGLIAKNGALL